MVVFFVQFFLKVGCDSPFCPSGVVARRQFSFSLSDQLSSKEDTEKALQKIFSFVASDESYCTGHFPSEPLNHTHYKESSVLDASGISQQAFVCDGKTDISDAHFISSPWFLPIQLSGCNLQLNSALQWLPRRLTVLEESFELGN